MFVQLPFMSDQVNKSFASDIPKLFSKFYPQIEFRLFFANNLSIGIYFSKIEYLPILEAKGYLSWWYWNYDMIFQNYDIEL